MVSVSSASPGSFRQGRTPGRWRAARLGRVLRDVDRLGRATGLGRILERDRRVEPRSALAKLPNAELESIPAATKPPWIGDSQNAPIWRSANSSRDRRSTMRKQRHEQGRDRERRNARLTDVPSRTPLDQCHPSSTAPQAMGSSHVGPGAVHAVPYLGGASAHHGPGPDLARCRAAALVDPATRQAGRASRGPPDAHRDRARPRPREPTSGRSRRCPASCSGRCTCSRRRSGHRGQGRCT